jgi:hypothetical protein
MLSPQCAARSASKPRFQTALISAALPHRETGELNFPEQE